jgi:hypothetical protein
MISRQHLWRGLCLILAMAWLGPSGGELPAQEAPAFGASAEEPARVPRQKRTARRGRGTGPRFQMMAAGERIVILDTQTGETRIIEPEPPGAKQTVKIGASWITVTVLVNVERAAKRSEKPALEK